MTGQEFAHLHVASSYSMRHGASAPQALTRTAAESGQSTLALTDRDGLYGAVQFAQACASEGIAPVLGVDLALAPGNLVPGVPAGRDPGRGGARPAPARGGRFRDPAGPRVVLLAQGRRGWAALCRVVSAAHAQGAAPGMPPHARPRGSGQVGMAWLTEEVISEHLGGGDLVVLLGPRSSVGQALARRRPDVAAELLGRWRSVVPPESLRIEIVNHRVRDATWSASGAFGAAGQSMASVVLARRMLEASDDLGIPAVLTNAVRYARPEQARTADLLDAIRRLVPLDARHLDGSNAEAYLKAGEQMRELAREACADSALGADRGAEALLRETAEVARRCELDPVADLGIGELHVPEVEVLRLDWGPGAPAQGSGDARGALGGWSGTRPDAAGLAELAQRCRSGLAWRGMPDSDAVRRRLDDELDTIAQLGFAGYFLTVAEVVWLIRGAGIRVAARGSGAGSLVNYLLGISGVDPMRYGLVMERFLSPLRRQLPDIDLDVESARRLEVYRMVFEHFGADRVACVAMFDTYRVRHAIRDAGSALGLPGSEIDAFAQAFPHIRAADARAALADLPELRRSGLGRRAASGELDGFLDLVESLDGLPRHVAMHPCGVILSDRSLLDRTPVQPSSEGFGMCHFGKDDVETMGLLKLDLLGIRMQSAMAHAVGEVERISGEHVELDEVPLDDPAAFELIRSTQTLGCFQIESPGQRELIGKFGPEVFGDLIIDISLFRPGPIKSDMVTPFLEARGGWRVPEYPHPDLIDALAETCGVVVFHEQVLRIVSVMTGVTLAEADEVRRALGDRDGQARIREWFYAEAATLGYDLATVERVWDVLAAFGSFGFCKAHAAAFALPTYQSAWLKAHHPAAFLAGVLTHDPGMYPRRLIAADARLGGIPVRGVDVQRSGEEYSVEPVGESAGESGAQPGPGDQAIRVPLSQVKGISDDEVRSVVAARPFEDMADLWHRTALSSRTLERLILVGALDGLHGLRESGAPGPLTRRHLLVMARELTGRRGGRRRLRPAGGPAAPATTRVRAEPPPRARSAGFAAPAGSEAARLVPVTARQLPLGLEESGSDVVPKSLAGLVPMRRDEQVQAELEILGMDVSSHLMDFYRDLLRELRAAPARDLRAQRNHAEVWVAGVKVAIQTPPIRSGRRVVFVSLDDGTGPADAAFFEEAQNEFAHTLFHSWLLLIRARVRRSGPRGVSLLGLGCWDLGLVHERFVSGGAAGLHEWAAEALGGGDPSQRQAEVVRRRMLVHASGFRQSAYADIRPAGRGESAGVPATPGALDHLAKLWHSSPGSAGR